MNQADNEAYAGAIEGRETTNTNTTNNKKPPRITGTAELETDNDVPTFAATARKAWLHIGKAEPVGYRSMLILCSTFMQGFGASHQVLWSPRSPLYV